MVGDPGQAPLSTLGGLCTGPCFLALARRGTPPFAGLLKSLLMGGSKGKLNIAVHLRITSSWSLLRGKRANSISLLRGHLCSGFQRIFLSGLLNHSHSVWLTLGVCWTPCRVGVEITWVGVPPAASCSRPSLPSADCTFLLFKGLPTIPGWQGGASPAHRASLAPSSSVWCLYMPHKLAQQMCLYSFQASSFKSDLSRGQVSLRQTIP